MSEEEELDFGHEIDLEDELAEQPAPQEPAAEPDVAEAVEWETGGPVAPPAFDFNDRLFAFGYSTSGKSEYLNLCFSGVACQKLLIDTKPEFYIEDVTAAHDPEELDWSAPILHYQPRPGSTCDQYEPIFQTALTLPGALVICVHEIQDLVDYKPQKAGRFLLGYAAKGARIQKGLLAASQRPRLVPTSAMAEARHVIVTVPQLARGDDMVTAAEMLSPVDGRPFTHQDLAHELTSIEQEHGPFSALWKDRRSQQLIAMPPIPQHLRDCSIVRRLEDG